MTTRIHEFAARLKVLQGVEDTVRENLPQLLKTVEESWQPSSFLPDARSENWHEEVRALRERSENLSDEILVVLVGDMITEEALPSYQTWINGLQGIGDPAGTGDTAWAQWSRGWTAEENRHGDLLNRYLYLTGRVDMRAVEVTIQHLIRNGFNPETENDPYLGFVYTSFQERATKISHRNVAILAARAGEPLLQNICGLIAGDEARHERAYKLFMQEIFRLDPAGAMIAFARMMKKNITMPAKLMDDGRDPGLFRHFSAVAQRIGVYTARDYAQIIEDLIRTWDVDHLAGLAGEAAEAQDYVCGLPARYEKLAQRFSAAAKTRHRFSWISDREA